MDPKTLGKFFVWYGASLITITLFELDGIAALLTIFISFIIWNHVKHNENNT